MALQKGMQSFHAYEKRVGETGREMIDGIGAEEKVFVIISKIYGIADGVLNMKIPGRLMEMGYRVLPFYYLPEGDISPKAPQYVLAFRSAYPQFRDCSSKSTPISTGFC